MAICIDISLGEYVDRAHSLNSKVVTKIHKSCEIFDRDTGEVSIPAILVFRKWFQNPLLTPRMCPLWRGLELLAARIGRAKLSPSEVGGMLRYTPKLTKGSDKLFRKLHDKGEWPRLFLSLDHANRVWRGRKTVRGVKLKTVSQIENSEGSQIYSLESNLGSSGINLGLSKIRTCTRASRFGFTSIR
ncbi:hypothetical protein ElyMa_001940800 [Elysia marginata]|uniref:TROVE domain-containing protein n=1 Tax=Elysia marginata TaxID=1093978 RepID=A0AAV4EVH7_9GAST|nr:hypothetical protein ElyMa_001940800 [Elysia marginata]